MPLFCKTIDGWQSWSEVFCDRQVFAPLIEEILRWHGLPLSPVEGLTPGTNAVFRAGNYVIKLYAPPESTLCDETGGLGEYQAGCAAAAAGLAVPRPVARGTLEDRYTFLYLVMEYLSGQEIGEALAELSAAQKRETGKALRGLCDTLHGANANACSACCVDLLTRSLENPRWQSVPALLAQQLKVRAKAVWQRRERHVLVHGDLTGENVLLLPEGRLALLDFGDAVLAPECYEWPSLFLEGMRADTDVLQGFLDGEPPEAWLEALLDGLSLHDFAGNLIADFARRKGIAIGQLNSLQALRQARLQKVFGRDI